MVNTITRRGQTSAIRRLSTILTFFKTIVPKLLSNPQIAELFRFLFLGTIVETSRIAGQKAVDFIKHCEWNVHPHLCTLTMQF